MVGWSSPPPNGRRDSKMTDAVEAALSRDLIQELAPDEVALCDALVETYHRSPRAVLGARRHPDQVLGFGIEGHQDLLAPILVVLAHEAVRFSRGEIVTTLKREG